ncbi:hypothetical protein ACJMK2_009028 [Sinanodonta woodiana]|uniref:CUB domain-containing protein n=1 Tax=Sinanodonta woodiana TaxID=1069815 RepID=A0ABD3VE17_SINWO
MTCVMVNGIFKLVMVIWMCTFFQTSLAATKTYYMEDQCGSIVDLAKEDTTAASVQLTNNISYNSNLDCTFQIRAPTEKRLMIRFLSLDIEWGATCSDDYLIIFDGQSQDGKAVQGDTGCDINEYQCQASLRCIEKNLKYDQYDNCGDGSDEYWIASGAIIGGIVGAAVAVCLLTGVVIYCCCKRAKKPVLEKERQKDVLRSPGSIPYSGYSLAHTPFTSSITKPPLYSKSYLSRNASSKIWMTVPPSPSHGGVTKSSYIQTTS